MKFLVTDCSEMPSPSEIRSALSRDAHVVLVFSRLRVWERYCLLSYFFLLFPYHERKYFTLYHGQEHRIAISRPVSKAVVRANRALFVEAGRTFISQGSELVLRLAKLFGTSVDRLTLTARETDSWKGIMDRDWGYFFHGLQVCFTHKSTRQVFDVNIYDFQNKASLLDPGFFHKFLESTAEYKRLAALLPNGYGDSHRVLSLLKDEILKP